MMLAIIFAFPLYFAYGFIRKIKLQKPTYKGVLPYILAFFIFKDPIKRQQIAGIITTLIGIVLLSVFSV